MNRLSRLIPITPVIRSSNATLANEKVFRVVDILIRPGLDTVDYLVHCALANRILVHSIHGEVTVYIHEVPGLLRSLEGCIVCRQTGRRRHPFDRRLQSQSPQDSRLD